MTQRLQRVVSFGLIVLAGLLALGATQIASQAGYAGVGPNFLPWLVAAVLAVCGAMLAWQAANGGFRQAEAPPGSAAGHWRGFAWVSAGILLNAALIVHIGFILSCTLCFVLAVQGYRGAAGEHRFGAAALGRDVLVGFAIAAPVYWMFTKLLAIHLPGLTASGWI